MRHTLLLFLVAAGCGDGGQPSPASPPGGAAGGGAAAEAPPFVLVDVTVEAGVTAATWCGRPDKPHILESNGTGLALLDVDADGALDLYLVNGWRLEGAAVVERGRNVLYRNRGDGRFDDVSAASGADDDGWGCGVAAGDVEGDGDPDLFVSNFGPDALLLNRGDGTFVPAAEAPGIDGWSAGAALFDADRDGDLDLFVAGYIQATLQEVLEARASLEWQGMDVMLGPFGLEGEPNRWFVNDGDGRFHEATAEAGLEDVGLFYSFGVMALDLDDDLDLDLYVANDSNPNYLYVNDGTGRFEETGLWSGAALDEGGQAQAGMGLAAGDVDGDGRPDLFVTNFSQDASTLYLNEGRCLFRDATRAFGLREPTYQPLSWGAAFGDLDLDGRLDLYVANGHIYPQADLVPEEAIGYAQPDLLLRGVGGRFEDVSSRSGPGLAVRRSSRGLALGDLDADGDLDLVVSAVDAPPVLLRNDGPRRGAWLQVEAPGAVRVEVQAGGRRLVRHALVGGSFLSVSDPRFHFGLGEVQEVDRLRAVWPDGSESIRTEVPVDGLVRLER